MIRDKTLQEVNRDFNKNIRVAFPYRSMYTITKEINNIIPDLCKLLRKHEKEYKAFRKKR